MLIEAYHAPDNSFHWLDVVDPTGYEFEALAKKYGLLPAWIQDCLDPKHLPKYEKLGHIDFIILRAFDESADPSANTLRELTQKLAIFVGQNYLITLHRREHPYLTHIRDHWTKTASLNQYALPKLLSKIILSSISTYHYTLNRSENRLEEFELLFSNEESTSLSIQEKFILKTQAYVFKRVLRLTLDIFPKFKIISDYDVSVFQDVKEALESAFFETENILEHVNALINLHLSLASHRTNQIIRVLTIVSIFFMPLTFIVGVYGMNFDYIPELKYHSAYFVLWIVMILISTGLFFWFKWKKWF